MRARVARVSLVGCLLLVSCAQAPNDVEPRDDVAQQVHYGSISTKYFVFVVTVKDDGEGVGGGWQKADAILPFGYVSAVFPHFWKCPIEVGMPLRTKQLGRISPSRAALYSAEIATEVAARLLDEQSWKGQTTLFCQELKAGMSATFHDRYPALGARVENR